MESSDLCEISIGVDKFWGAHDDNMFPLPIVAFALGIGRNKMCKLPVAFVMIEKRKCYRKGAILDWALSDEGKKTLTHLRSENTSIGRAIKTQTKLYDRYYQNAPNSYYKPSNGINETKQDKHERLCREWSDIQRRLNTCYDDVNLKALIRVTWTIREQFVKLRMGFPYGMKFRNGMQIRNWWFAESFTKAKCERTRQHIDDLKFEPQYSRITADEAISISNEIVQLNAELSEIK